MHAVGGTIAEASDQHLTEMGMVDDDFVQASSPEGIDEVKDQGAPADFQQRLRAAVGQRPQTLAASGRQNHCLHVASEDAASDDNPRSSTRVCKGCRSECRLLTSST